MTELKRDEYLGGRVSVLQPVKGYRAGTDAVMLAAAVNAKSGQSVLELGAGAGVASACLKWRVPECVMTAVERDPFYADLARQNLDANLVQADLASLPKEVSDQSFDFVMFNPPFFRHEGKGEHELKKTAHVEETPLETWVEVARKRLRPKGHLIAIHRAERLAELVTHLHGMGDVTILPIAARAGHEAKRFIISARKGGAGPSRILPSFVMHKGDAHLSDADDYSDAAQAVLRDGAAISLNK